MRAWEPDLDTAMRRPVGTEINLHLPALLPDDYLNDVHLRLVHYKQQIASARSNGGAAGNCRWNWSIALAPRPTRRWRCSPAIGCGWPARSSASAKIDASAERTTIQFVKHPPFDAGALILLVQKDGRIRFAGQDRLRIERAAPTLGDRIALVTDFLRRLA